MQRLAANLRSDRWFPLNVTNQQLEVVVQQGIVGDCAFLSALVSFVRSTPLNDIHARIGLAPNQPQGGRRLFQVRLFNLQANQWQWINVLEPTDPQRLLFGNASDGYLWVSLFEQAYLELFRRETTREMVWTTVRAGSYFERIIDSEELQQGIRRLTGSPNVTVRAINTLNADGLANALDLALRPGGGPIVRVSTLPTLPEDAMRLLGLVPAHAYAVVGFNRVTGVVRLRNPWNNAQLPGGAEFTLNLDQLRRYFNHVARDAIFAAGP